MDRYTRNLLTFPGTLGEGAAPGAAFWACAMPATANAAIATKGIHFMAHILL
jgi:hypothetical protein